MAKTSNVGTRIWLDQYDLSGFLNSAEQAVSQKMIDWTCFSDAGPRRGVGNHDHRHNQNGFFDGDEHMIDEIIDALRGNASEHYLAKLWGASSAGSVVHEFIAKISAEPRSGGQDGAVLLNSAFEGSGHASRGLVLLNNTINGNGNQTGRNVGATAAGQVFQTVIRVPSGTFTSFTVKLQESQNDGAPDAYADIAGLSQAITGPGVWRLTTVAATEAWKRVVIADWVGTNAVVRVTAGVVAGT